MAQLSRIDIETGFGIQVLERLDQDAGEQLPHYSTAQAEIAKLDLEDEWRKPSKGTAPTGGGACIGDGLWVYGGRAR